MKRGFTLIELFVVIAIVLILFVVIAIVLTLGVIFFGGVVRGCKPSIGRELELVSHENNGVMIKRHWHDRNSGE